MSVTERILSLKLIEAQKSQTSYMNRIGITVTLIEVQESNNDCKKHEGVDWYDKNGRD